MLTIVFGLIGIFVIIFQTALLPTSLAATIQLPDLVFVYIVYCAYRFNLLQGIFLAFSVSWLQDVVGAVKLGLYPVECLIIFFIFRFLSQNNPIKNVLFQFPLVGLAYFVMQLIVTMLHTLMDPISQPPILWIPLSMESFFVFLISVPSFAIFNYIYRWCEKRGIAHKPRRQSMVKKG